MGYCIYDINTRYWYVIRFSYCETNPAQNPRVHTYLGQIVYPHDDQL